MYCPEIVHGARLFKRREEKTFVKIIFFKSIKQRGYDEKSVWCSCILCKDAFLKTLHNSELS
jgi:hypothetical protein